MLFLPLDVMEHFEKRRILDLFKLIYKKLANDGKFIIKVPNGGSLPGLYIFHSDLSHEIAFTDLLLKELFFLAGFDGFKILPGARKGNFKKIILYPLRKILSHALALDNKFIFSTNIIAVAYKE